MGDTKSKYDQGWGKSHRFLWTKAFVTQVCSEKWSQRRMGDTGPKHGQGWTQIFTSSWTMRLQCTAGIRFYGNSTIIYSILHHDTAEFSATED